MRVEVRLVHAEPGRRVVLVRAWEGERSLGSALGEGADVEEAEGRAEARLLARLGDPVGGCPSGEGAAAGATPPPRPLQAPPAQPPQTPPLPLPQPQPPQQQPRQPRVPEVPEGPVPPATATAPAAGEPPAAGEGSAAEGARTDPEDWSEELATLDLELRRLGWGREEEETYLQRVFGHPSRSRLTSYADLVAYLRAVEALPAGVEPLRAPVPLRRRDLLSQCDQLLERLGWGAEEGRRFLERHLGVGSRQHLDDSQLLRFNMLLEEELPVPPGGSG